MVTNVQDAFSTAAKPPSNMSERTPQSHLPSHTQAQTNISEPSSHHATVTRKKKKKKNSTTPFSPQHVNAGVVGSSSQTAFSNSNAGDISDYTSASSASSPTFDAAVTEQWKQRVQSLRTALNKAQKENQLLTSDLAAALARANDAEHAEDTVNKGLLTARSVISQRDRAIAELRCTSSNLRADLGNLQEEKKKTDKRLVLLRTVSANLQEARENRDAAEKKLDDAISEISVQKERNISLGKDVETLKKHVEAMKMVKQQLARREIEIDELSRAKQRVEEEAHQAELRAFTVGAISMLVVGVIVRVLGKGSIKDRE